jgi:tetratricopeptide (TPR) repeat protein
VADLAAYDKEFEMGNGELPKALHERIIRLCQEGDDLSENRADQAAYNKYDEAWNLVPEPKSDWEASTWILGAVGDLQFRRKTFDKALTSFLRAVQCPGGLGNPYIHLRIGQAQYELGNLEGAGDNLTRAYMGAGEAIFKDEQAKYLAYLHTILRPPETQR